MRSFCRSQGKKQNVFVYEELYSAKSSFFYLTKLILTGTWTLEGANEIVPWFWLSVINYILCFPFTLLISLPIFRCQIMHYTSHVVDHPSSLISSEIEASFLKKINGFFLYNCKFVYSTFSSSSSSFTKYPKGVVYLSMTINIPAWFGIE